MLLSLGEQGGITEQMTSCEESGKLGGGDSTEGGGKKRSQNTLLSETPMQETSVKDVPPLPLLFPFISKLTHLRGILKSFIPHGVMNNFLFLHHLTEY